MADDKEFTIQPGEKLVCVNCGSHIGKFTKAFGDIIHESPHVCIYNLKEQLKTKDEVFINIISEDETKVYKDILAIMQNIHNDMDCLLTNIIAVSERCKSRLKDLLDKETNDRLGI